MRACHLGVHLGQIPQREGAVEVAVLEDELAHPVGKPPQRVAQLRQRCLPQVPAHPSVSDICTCLKCNFFERKEVTVRVLFICGSSTKVCCAAAAVPMKFAQMFAACPPLGPDVSMYGGEPVLCLSTSETMKIRRVPRESPPQEPLCWVSWV